MITLPCPYCGFVLSDDRTNENETPYYDVTSATFETCNVLFPEPFAEKSIITCFRCKAEIELTRIGGSITQFRFANSEETYENARIKAYKVKLVRECLDRLRRLRFEAF